MPTRIRLSINARTSAPIRGEVNVWALWGGALRDADDGEFGGRRSTPVFPYQKSICPPNFNNRGARMAVGVSHAAPYRVFTPVTGLALSRL